MRRLLPLFFACLLLLLTYATTLAAPVVQAQTATTYAGIVNSTANIRSGPGLQFDVVDQAQNGDALTVIACNEDCSWYKLDNGNWIAAFLVDLGEPNGTTTLPENSSTQSNGNGENSSGESAGRTRSRSLDPDDLVLNDPSPAALEIVQQILSYVGLPQNFDVYSANIYNAAALMVNGERVILYDPQLIADIEDIANHDWPAVSILAHEIGHHLAGHTLSEVYNRDFELEADYFSGFILQKMGATLDEAQTVMSLLRDHPNMTDHPPQAERLAVIEQGWQDAARQQGLVWEPNFSTFIEEGTPTVEANATAPNSPTPNPTTPNVIGVLAQARDSQLARQQDAAALAVRDWGAGLRALVD